MDEHTIRKEIDEMEERLGDLWSLNKEEQDHLGRFAVVATIVFVVVFVSAACFIIFR